jgi:Fe-S-cluster containining protein
MIIPVDPYEIARLARRLGETTTLFRSTRTEGGEGACLGHTQTGACVLLGPQGCSVYEDRPLACRIYPLALQLDADGTERWSHHVQHPQSPGDYTVTGTIADYLAGQDTARHLQAFGEYSAWARLARDRLAADLTCTQPREAGADTGILDMDLAIAQYCAANCATEPSDIEARKRLHLFILYDLLNELSELPHNDVAEPPCPTNPTTRTKRQTAQPPLLAAVATLSASLGITEAEAASVNSVM